MTVRWLAGMGQFIDFKGRIVGIKRLGSLLVMACCCFPGHAGAGVSLTIEVSGGEPGRGQIRCALYTSQATFLSRPSARQWQDVNKKGMATCRFDDLEPGEYAVGAAYDRNGNGELDRGFLGIPTEPVAVSNNARGFMGPPDYEDARFELQQDHLLRIRLSGAR